MRNKNSKPFSGRVIFDHIPKTGGTAITSWLINELGSGVVTGAISGEHDYVIEVFGGNFPVISGHIYFVNGHLNPMYEYITLLREPIDRTISWLFFVINNHDELQINSELFEEAKRFIATEGEELGEHIFGHISNVYMSHFSAISNNDSIESCLITLEKYVVVGLYEYMSRFVLDVANFIGIPNPVELKKVNVTKQRPMVAEISPRLHQRLIELNSLDIALYQQVKAWQKRKWSEEFSLVADTSVSLWSKYELPIIGIIRNPYGRIDIAHSNYSIKQSGFFGKNGKLESFFCQLMGFWHKNDSYSVKCGEMFALPITIYNDSDQIWKNDILRPVNISYHWLNPKTDEMIVFDGLRTGLNSSIFPHSHFPCHMNIIAPELPGTYFLILTLVQETVNWFEEVGFTPTKITVSVVQS